MSKAKKNEQWTTVIRSKNNSLNMDIKDLIHYRDLIFLFVRRDFVSVYKQTILGPLWYLIQPLFTTIVFTIIFGNIARIPTDGMPQMVFYMAGTIMWNFFSASLNKTSTTFSSNSGIFGKVYFPRLTVPISVIISNTFTFIIQFILFLGFLFFFLIIGSSVKPNFWIILSPLLVIQTALLGMGVGLFISAITIKYRDLQFIVGFGTQLWMYATPIVYPMSQVPIKWQFIYMINPMSAIIETFRYGFLGSGNLNFFNIGISVIITITIFYFGLVMFDRAEKTFMDKV